MVREMKNLIFLRYELNAFRDHVYRSRTTVVRNVLGRTCRSLPNVVYCVRVFVRLCL